MKLNLHNILFGGTERTTKIKKNILESFAIKGASIIISFMLVPLTIGYVSSELYGVWLTLASILTWIGFLDMGFGQGLKNKLTEAIALKNWKRGKQLVSTTYFLMIAIFVPIGILLEFMIPLVHWSKLLNVNEYYNGQIQDVMQVLVGFVCLQMVVNIFVSVVAAFQQVALSSLFNTIGNFLSLIAIIILKKTVPPSLMALAFSIGLFPILVTLFSSILFYKRKYHSIAPSIGQVDKFIIRDIFSLGYKFFIANVQAVILYQATNVLISNVSSPLQVTTYNIAYKYLNIAMLVYTIISAPLWPAYTDAYVKNDFEWMKRIRNKLSKIYFLSIVICLIMVTLSKYVYFVWIGNKVEVSFIMTLMVATYVIVYGWVQLNGTIICGMGTMKLNTYVLIIGMIIHVPLSLLLGHSIGAYGVLTSMITINVVYGLFYHVQVSKILNKTAKGIWLQ